MKEKFQRPMVFCLLPEGDVVGLALIVLSGHLSAPAARRVAYGYSSFF
jgi:hypothetical protein